MRAIAARLGRSPSTISRELERNTGRSGLSHNEGARARLRARVTAQALKPTVNLVLRAKVEQDLKKRCSPEQIAGRLRREFPDDAEMRVSIETT